MTTSQEEEGGFGALDDLGARLRELRNEKKMTLAELSLKSQVSIGMLSHIERGQTSPSLKTLERLRLALEVPLARFFEREEPKPANNGTVVRATARSQLPFKKLGLVKELLSPPGHSDLEMLMLVIEPGGSSGPEPWTRRGEKAGLVLEGTFELHVAESSHVLEQGDSFQFDGRQPHFFRNLADSRTRVLWIIKSEEPG
ncbi:helix-turn-helix domain-containing protein [Roseateles toxinivorans]|uniref:XRE family transcriptional regulator n=1 Tax=Roseateles toxinivorans TaxID=270368 RepID=A0A4R6QHN8_9BURK|nr:XRE family transcriptional regulator [Roseateles toxinivorans]TDP62052.1 XRE family transcriptional regulator [Roseateles toxinivorans]